MAMTANPNHFSGSAIRYAEFVDGIPIAVYRTTLEGKIVYCNQAFVQLFGYTDASEIIGNPIVELYLNKKDRGALVHAVSKDGLLTNLAAAFRRKDGVRIWCTVTAKSVMDDDGMVIYLDEVVRDITSEVDVNADKFKGVLEMAGGAAHSLNQPLTIINNLLNELISNSNREDLISRQVDKIHEQVQRLNEIIRKISNIRKYKAVDYVAGVKIVDIDKASIQSDGRDSK